LSESNKLLGTLDNSLTEFRTKINDKIGRISSSSVSILDSADSIYNNIGKLKSDMLGNEEKHIALENILRLNQAVKEKFSHYETIRRTVMGVVREFDINLIRNSTIQELSEELWVTSSRYWLSYALIAITAWVNDYKVIAQNAIAESMRKDPIKSSLFFCLTNLRYGRREAAGKWLLAYMKVQNPEELKEETSVLIECFINGIFGQDAELERRVENLIDGWIASFGSNDATASEICDAYKNFIDNLPEGSCGEYNTLAENSEEGQAINEISRSLSKIDSLSDFLKTLDVGLPKYGDVSLNAKLDSILSELVGSSDEEELKMKNQQEYYRIIIDSNGDRAEAERIMKEKEELVSGDFNVGKQMLRWALYDDDIKTNIYVRRFGFCSTKFLFCKAFSDWFANVSEAKPNAYKIKIDDWDTVSNGNDLAEQTGQLKDHFKINKFNIVYSNAVTIIMSVLFLLSLCMTVITAYSLAVAAAFGIGLIVCRVYYGKKYKENQMSALRILEKSILEIKQFEKESEESVTKRKALLEQAGLI